MADSVLLTMEGVRKRFGAVAALDGVDLEVREGEVHALIGENGAGKSTLMRILAGAVRCDAGAILLEGKLFSPKNPLDALRRGVAMVYQELLLAPDLSIEDNVFLGRRGWLEPRRKSRPTVVELLAELGHAELDPETPVGRYGPGPRQIVAIARALVADARVVVLDEPTSSLAAADVERLFDAVGRLKKRGVSVIYISHFLEEIERIADRFTVLRNGQTVHRGSIRAGAVPEILKAMVGRDLGEVYPDASREPGQAALSVKSAIGRTRFQAADFELRRGEVFGVAGLVGAGRTELLRALFGLDPLRRGEIRLAGGRSVGTRPFGRAAQGIAYLSEDRRHEGLALDRSIAENLTLPDQRRFARFGFVNAKARDGEAEHWIRTLRIRCAGPSQPVRELSGGNQQKVALARLLFSEAKVWLLDEPTRGVDIGSKSEIYDVIADAAGRGTAILLVSSYFPELLGLCDRIAVMHRGRLGAARPRKQWTESSLLDTATRGESKPDAA